MNEPERRFLDSIRSKPILLAYSYELLYNELPDGRRVGLLMPLIDFLEKDLGLAVQTRKLAWNEAFVQIENGEVDYYGPITLTERRRQDYITISPLLRVEAQIVSRVNDPLHSLLHLRNKNIGLLEGSVITQPIYLYAHSGGKIVYFPTMNAMIGGLETGEIDCFATVDNAELEILDRPDIQYEFTIRDFYVEQGFIGKRRETEPLTGIINRYLKTPAGKALGQAVRESRKEELLRSRRELFAAEIEHLRKNYPVVKMYGLCELYPLCYEEKGRKKGMIPEVNQLFREWTGVEIEIGTFGAEERGDREALQMIEENRVHLTGGVYSNTAAWEEAGFAYSEPIFTDHIRSYTYGSPPADLRHSRIGVGSNVLDYIHWDLVTDEPPEVFQSRRALMEALKKKHIDVAFLGEMRFNYHHHVLKDHMLQDFGNIVAAVDLRLIYGKQHPELNRLMGETLRLYRVMSPTARIHWENLAEKQRSEYIRLRNDQRVRFYRLMAVFLILAVCIFLLLYHYIQYDRQIRRLIRKQQTFDLMWGNLRTRTLKSKGQHTLFKKWGLGLGRSAYPIGKVSGGFNRDLFKEYGETLEKMRRENLTLLIDDKELLTPHDGKKYYRRYFHRLGKSRFMLCVQEITDQKEAEQQEQFLNELFGALRDGFLFLDRDYNVLRYNEAMVRLFPKFDPKKRFCFSRFRGRDSRCGNCPVQEAFHDGGKHSRIEYLEDSRTWIEMSAFPLKDPKTGETIRVLEFVRDITDQHHREEDLEHREHFLAGILNSSHDGIIAISDAEGVTHFNPRLKEMFYEDPDLYLGSSEKRIYELQKRYSLNTDVIYEARQRIRKNHTPQRGILHLHDGRIYEWTAVSIDMGRKVEPEYLTRFWTFHDATEIYRAAEEIRKSEERFRTLFTTMPSGLALFDTIMDENGNVVDLIYTGINPALEQINGMSESQTVGKRLLELFPDLRIISEQFQGKSILALCTEVLHGEHLWCMVFNEATKTYDRIGVFSTGADKLVMYIIDETEAWKTQEVIRQSENRFRSLFMSMSNGLVLLDVVRDEKGRPVDFLISSTNPALDTIVQKTREEMVGSSLFSLAGKVQVTSHAFGDRWWTGIEAAAEGITGSYHVFIEQFQPSPYQEVIIFPFGEDCVGILMYDETYRIRSEQSLRTMQLIIDHISEPVLWLFPDGTVQYVNVAAATTLGFDSTGLTPDGPVGEKIWRFDGTVDPENWESFVQRASEEKTLRFETVMTRKDGSTFPALAVADLLEQNDEQFIAACFHDLSEQIRRIEAEQTSLAKSKFLDHMSHEIRTPLNGVIGIAEILLGTELQPKQQEYVELVRTSGRHLLALLNNILDFSKLDSGELKLHPSQFDLTELLESLFGVIAPQAYEKHLELIGTVSPKVPRLLYGDVGRLRQILNNLLNNAVKFTPAGAVRLSVSVSEQDSRNDSSLCVLRLDIVDSGIGISEEKMNNLFESFTLGDTSFSREYGGTGLGLVIARELVELMRGTIEVESTEQVGTSFHLTLPFEIRSGAVPNEVSSPDCSELAGRTVLFVDENEIFLKTLSEQFQNLGMQVLTCKTREEAFTILKESAQRGSPCDLAVIDYCLQDGPGAELIERIREDSDLSRTPIIMMTPLTEDFSRSKTVLHHADRLVTKPIFDSMLLKAVLGIFASNEESAPESRPVEAGEENGEPPSEEEPLLLVVEDNRINQIVVGEILKQADWKYEIAENGLRACESLAAKRFSLVLMDCQMPVMDGFEATRTIRKMEAGLADTPSQHRGRIPIIALTANAMDGDEEKCLQAGMDAFCSKPVNAEKLLATIRKYLKKHS